MTTAEGITVVLVAAYYGGKWESARLYLKEHGFIPSMLSKSRLCRHIHAVPQAAWQVVASVLAKVYRRAGAANELLVDSLSVPMGANIRIRRCRLYEGKAYHGYVAANRVYFLWLRIHLLCTASGRPVEIVLAPSGIANIVMFWTLGCGLPAGSRLMGDKEYLSAEEK